MDTAGHGQWNVAQSTTIRSINCYITIMFGVIPCSVLFRVDVGPKWVQTLGRGTGLRRTRAIPALSQSNKITLLRSDVRSICLL